MSEQYLSSDKKSELIWVPAEFSVEVKSITDLEKAAEAIKKIISYKTEALFEHNNNLLEQVEKILKNIENKKEELETKYEELYDIYYEKEKKLNEKLSLIDERAKKVRENIDALNVSLSKLNIYDLDRTLEMLNKFENSTASVKKLFLKAISE